MQSVVIASLLLLATSFVSAQNQPSAQTLAENDIHVLQYALILENLEYTFYTQYQNTFTAQNFIDAGLTANDYSYFNIIQQHEQAHVIFLNSTVPSPTSSCTYNFGVTTVQQYISLARVLENTGVSAYDGAINNIYNPVFAQYAATIATVEARHASYLNKINSQIPFPDAFDTAKNATTIRDIVFGGSSPLASCQFVPGFTLPVLLTVIPVQNASDPSQPTSGQLKDNDYLVLQYALFLEHFEAAFYNYVNSTFSASAFGAQTYNYIQLIQNHENTHVAALTDVISKYTTPIADCVYNFSGMIGTNATVALQTAAALENTGVGAYDGAVNAINDATLKQIAATIATVEARHASYINFIINSQGPVQGNAGAYDTAYNFSTTFGIVVSTNLIVSCPAFPSQFKVLVVKPYTNGTVTTPTNAPTGSPTTAPTSAPTNGPTSTPTSAPTNGPTSTPTSAPTTGPTSTPTNAPTTGPTSAPTPAPTPAATTRGSSTTARTTSGASIASASVVVALLVAVAAM